LTPSKIFLNIRCNGNATGSLNTFWLLRAVSFPYEFDYRTLVQPKRQTPQVKAESLHASGSWLIGTVVALALREALTTCVPHIVDPHSHLHQGVDHPGRILTLETIRLCVFMVVTLRFFLGSVEFFQEVLEEAVRNNSNEAYSKDFLFGIVHFIIFLAWAVTVDVNDIGELWFLGILGMILLYDIPWCLLRPKQSSNHNKVKLWAVMNAVTVVFSIAAFFAMRTFFGDRGDWWEEMALLPVMCGSAFDLWGILTDDPIIPKFLRDLTT
jgi:hypothetical protein